MAGVGVGVPDLVGPGIRVLFCGINPGLVSAARGQHFARPGNRFWKVLHASGFTGRVLAPAEQDELLGLGIGITNLVARASSAASELTTSELREGARLLKATVASVRPTYVAVLGVGAYRSAFGRPRSNIGAQAERIGPSGLWVLPNPSGLQARYQLPEMAVMFRELRLAAGMKDREAPEGALRPAR
jgi:TDG/mug DNA glycosylase family protein